VPSRLLSYSSVAQLLDCSDDTVRRLVKRGLLPEPVPYKGLGKRFSEDDILLYLVRAREDRQDDLPRRRTTQEDANSGGAKGP
jgi:excisionase family DNA binding protein